MQARMPDRSGGELVEGRTRLDGVPSNPSGPQILPKVKVTALHAAQPRISTYYEASAFNTMQALWRRRILLGVCLLLGALTGVALIIVLPKEYNAEAVISLDFVAARAATGAAAAAPTANLDAGILVEGEARMVRSPMMTRRVVSRLKLDEDPAYNSTGPLSKVLRYINPPAASAPEISTTDIAASKLARQVKITNDNRAYLINIAVPSHSPEWSAKLANAFATEYLIYRSLQFLQSQEANARGALQDARAIFGEKHPTVIQAKAQLEAVQARIRAEEGKSYDEVNAPPGTSFLAAEPIWIPSGPNPIALVGMSLVGAMLLGIGGALFLERRNTSLRTERSVAGETGIRCVGMIPLYSDRNSAERKLEQSEAFRSLCLTVGAGGPARGRAPYRAGQLRIADEGQGALRARACRLHER